MEAPDQDRIGRGALHYRHLDRYVDRRRWTLCVRVDREGGRRRPWARRARAGDARSGRIAWDHKQLQFADLTHWRGENDHAGLAVLVEGVMRLCGVRQRPADNEVAAWAAAEASPALQTYRAFAANYPQQPLHRSGQGSRARIGRGGRLVGARPSADLDGADRLLRKWPIAPGSRTKPRLGSRAAGGRRAAGAALQASTRRQPHARRNISRRRPLRRAREGTSPNDPNGYFPRLAPARSRSSRC